MPGRQEAKTTSAMQIQPRPLIISKKNALKADMVRKAPPSAISARAGDDGADADGGDARGPAPRRRPGFRRPRGPQGPAACGRARRRRRANSAKARKVSGVCSNSAGPMKRKVREAGNVSGWNGTMRRRRRDVRQREAIDEVGRALVANSVMPMPVTCCDRPSGTVSSACSSPKAAPVSAATSDAGPQTPPR